MPYHQWVAASTRGMRTLLQGSLETAEEQAEGALALLPGRRDAIYAHLNQITQIRWDQGRLELRGVWQGIVDQFPQTGFSRGWLCLADAELGRQDDAQRWLRSLVDAIRKLSRNRIWLAALAVASVAAALLEDADSAASVHPLLLPYAERTIVMSVPHPVVCFGSASLYVALLEATMSPGTRPRTTSDRRSARTRAWGRDPC